MNGTRKTRQALTSAAPRNRVRPLFASALALALSLFASAPSWATGSVLSGMFDGSEPAIDALSPSACAQSTLAYRLSTFEVSQSGTYRFYDAFGALRFSGGIDISAQIHEGSFDSSDPRLNLLASGGLDHSDGAVNLARDTNYVLVVQHACTPRDGAWAVIFTGPGEVSSDNSVEGPTFTSGFFFGGEPKIDNHCQETWNEFPSKTPYQQTGPVRVARDGTYYFSASNRQALCLSVYEAPVDAASPHANFVAARTGAGTIELRAGQDYYFLVHRGDAAGASEYFFVLAPPAPFRINPGLSDSWYNPETPGQGFFLDVFENMNQVFLGWFTFANQPAASGDGGQRWMTAFGNFEGASAELLVEWTAGGAFDAAHPAPEQEVDGFIQLDFTDCASGQVSYNFGGGASDLPLVSGVIPIQRLADDSVALCESLYAGPGVPGPL